MVVPTAARTIVGDGRRGLTPNRAALLLLLVLIALGAVTAWSLLITLPIVVLTVRRIRCWDGVTLGAMLILAGSALSLMATINMSVSLTALGGVVGAFAVTVLLIRCWNTAARLTGSLGLYVAVACALVLLATIQVDIQFAKLNGMSQAVYAWFDRWPHLDNVGFSQNATGALIVAVCPFSIAFACRRGSRLGRLGAAVATLWFLFALVLTLSRGAYFGLALGIGAMIWLNGGRTRWLAPVPTLLTLALLLAGVTGYEFTLSATPTGWSSVDRLYIWHTAVRILADFPITGPGIGTFPLRVPAYTWPMEARDIPHAHNFVLQTYLDSGLVGLIGMLLLLLGFGYGGLRLLSRPLDRQLRPALLAGAGAMVGTLAQGSVDAYFWGDARTFYVVALPIAVLVSVARLRAVSLAFPESPALATRLARWRSALRSGSGGAYRRSPRAIALALAALLLAANGFRPLASLALANGGNVLREHGERMPTGSASQALTFALARHELALSGALEPGYGAAWQDLAEVYLAERNTSEASLYLGLASQEGQRDALALRDESRLSRIAVAQVSPSLHAPH